MALVVSAAFEVIDGIGGLCERFGGISQLFFDLRLCADKQTVTPVRLSRQCADAADDRLSFLDLIAVDVQHQCQTQCWPLLKLKFEVSRAVSLRRDWDLDCDEKLVVCEGRFISSLNELVDRQRFGSRIAADMRFRAQGEK